MADIHEVIHAALRRASWSPHEIDTALAELQEGILTDPSLSDHTAYRELAEALGGQIQVLSGDANLWDGDGDELSLLTDWLKISGEWLPELYAHLAAEKIRHTCECLAGSGSCEAAADRIDPWLSSTDPESWGQLARKGDHTEVPWQIVSAAELLYGEK